MFIDFLIDSFEKNKNKEAIVWRDKTYSYGWLSDRVHYWENALSHKEVPSGSVVVLEGDFSPNAVAIFLALAERGVILVPLTSASAPKRAEFTEIAQGQVAIYLDDSDDVQIRQISGSANHPFYGKLREQKHPGLVLFSSGSTGKSKAAVHDLVAVLEKFKVSRFGLRTISFLLYDHMGGLNTMFYVLSNGGCLVTVSDRSPDNVLQAVERHRVELLPASPTFLNLVLLSEAYKKHDLSSLKTISYGTEPMTESTLGRLHELFPQIKLLQTYGLSEVGVLRSKSKSSDSLWFKVGGEGFETRVVNNILQIKAKSAMLGYLNSPSPFAEDGWFDTGDEVVVEGDYLRILGRKSEFINVGGEKVFPTEVENILQLIEGVEDVAVCGKANPITGQIVSARIKLRTPEAPGDFRKRMRQFCKDKLPSFKIPQEVTLVNEPLYGERLKKLRIS